MIDENFDEGRARVELRNGKKEGEVEKKKEEG